MFVMCWIFGVCDEHLGESTSQKCVYAVILRMFIKVFGLK